MADKADTPAVEAPRHQVMAIATSFNGNLIVLYSDGEVFERRKDEKYFGQGSPPMIWEPVKLPVRE